MPAAREILSSLTTVTNGATTLAVLWHAVVFVVLAAVAAGFRPSRRALAWHTPPVEIERADARMAK